MSNNIDWGDDAEEFEEEEEVQPGITVEALEELVREKEVLPQLEAVFQSGPLLEHIIVLVGATGSGKSTCVNYLSGLEMSTNSQGRIVVANSGEVAKIGHSKAISETVVPNAVNIPAKNATIIDTAGFGDSRGPLYDMITSFCLTETISKIPTDVAAICIMIPYGQFDQAAGRWTIIDKIQRLRGDLLDVPTKKEPRIFYLISNVPREVTEDGFTREILDVYRETKKSKEIDPATKKERLKQLQDIGDYFMFVRPLVRSEVDNILGRIIGGERSGDVRRSRVEQAWFRQVIDDRVLCIAKSLVIDILRRPTGIVDDLQNSIDNLERLKTQSVAVETEVEALNAQIAHVKETGDTAASIETDITNLGKKRTALRAEIRGTEDTIQELERTLEMEYNTLNSLDSGEMKTIYSETVSKFEKLFSTSVIFEYDGFPFDEHTEEAQFGKTEIITCSKSSGSYKMKFSPQMWKKAVCTVKIYCQKRNLPDSRSGIKAAKERTERITKQLKEKRVIIEDLRTEEEEVQDKLELKRLERRDLRVSAKEMLEDYNDRLRQAEDTLAEVLTKRNNVDDVLRNLIGEVIEAVRPMYTYLPFFLRTKALKADFESALNVGGAIIGALDSIPDLGESYRVLEEMRALHMVFKERCRPVMRSRRLSRTYTPS